MFEAWILGVDDNLRDNRNDLLLQSLSQEFVLQRLCDLHADGALRVGDAVRQRYLVKNVLGELGTKQHEAYLRTVAMRNDHPVASGHDRGYMLARLACRPVLVEHVHVLAILDQRVATDGYDDQRLVTVFVSLFAH